MQGEHNRETTAQSPFSPGPVGNDERLIRAMFCPDHYDLNGSILPSAITSQDLVNPNRGYSLQRRNYLLRESLENLVNQTISRNAERRLVGIAQVFAHAIRAIQDTEGCQAFCVIDAAESLDDVAHALIFCTKDYPQSIIKKAKKDLIEVFSTLESIGNIFPHLKEPDFTQ